MEASGSVFGHREGAQPDGVRARRGFGVGRGSSKVLLGTRIWVLYKW